MLSQNIKALRIQKGLTQKDLADLLHVTSQAVSRWELGDVEPSIDTISNMAKIFNVTTDEIIGGPENKPKPEVIKQVEEKVVIQQAKPVLAVCDHICVCVFAEVAGMRRLSVDDQNRGTDLSGIRQDRLIDKTFASDHVPPSV